jgi:hypothetical protein
LIAEVLRQVSHRFTVEVTVSKGEGCWLYDDMW